jgi:hypothetical protein
MVDTAVEMRPPSSTVLWYFRVCYIQVFSEVLKTSDPFTPTNLARHERRVVCQESYFNFVITGAALHVEGSMLTLFLEGQQCSLFVYNSKCTAHMVWCGEAFEPVQYSTDSRVTHHIEEGLAVSLILVTFVFEASAAVTRWDSPSPHTMKNVACCVVASVACGFQHRLWSPSRGIVD